MNTERLLLLTTKPDKLYHTSISLIEQLCIRRITKILNMLIFKLLIIRNFKKDSITIEID